ncbi:DUF2726 domain-containing protein [Oleomonas cavernae]|nr:DUF2726 domain-containing protein [Oleomonas cavernae]
MADIHFIEGQIGEIASVDIHLIALIVGGVIIGMVLEHWRAEFMKRRWRARREARGRKPADNIFWVRNTAVPPIADAPEQLRVVMKAVFSKRPLLSKSEALVFYAAENAVKETGLSWRVMAQVSLGEILSSPSADAYAAINSKRADVLIVTQAGDPIVAIEYQGHGHYQGSAPARDAVKKEALRKAGVRYIEMTPEHGPDDLVREIMRIARVINPVSPNRGVPSPKTPDQAIPDAGPSA